MQLGQAVDSVPKEVGPRMVEAIPAGIVAGRAQPEVGAEVDDRRSDGCNRRDEIRGRAVRQREKHGVDGRQLGVDGEPGAPEMCVDLADG